MKSGEDWTDQFKNTYKVVGVKSDAQKAADRQLEEAIQAACGAYDLLDGAMLVDFICVVEGVKMDDESEMTNEFFGMAFRNGHCRTVVALGLLEKGNELLSLAGIRVDDEEEDD